MIKHACRVAVLKSIREKFEFCHNIKQTNKDLSKATSNQIIKKKKNTFCNSVVYK